MKSKIFLIAGLMNLVMLASRCFAAEWTGVVTETHCGAMHRNGTPKDVECIKKCVLSGDGKLALLVADKLFTISNPEKATGHEGQQVKVIGTTDEATQTLAIDSISPAA